MCCTQLFLDLSSAKSCTKSFFRTSKGLCTFSFLLIKSNWKDHSRSARSSRTTNWSSINEMVALEAIDWKHKRNQMMLKLSKQKCNSERQVQVFVVGFESSLATLRLRASMLGFNFLHLLGGRKKESSQTSFPKVSFLSKSDFLPFPLSHSLLLRP